MIHFTLFGIPIYIRPTFWIVLAIFGGILGVSSVESLIYPALFVIAGFIAILSTNWGMPWWAANWGEASKPLSWNSSAA